MVTAAKINRDGLVNHFIEKKSHIPETATTSKRFDNTRVNIIAEQG